ncbi:hypothetical protein KDA_02630 [Dictyobacter alpinus]|uniref:Nudix hydrolase domain-containing protein n=1 Tax=Dictyobacter alpinus TaxID=2014873 RepID=A0A402B0A5_9CHLR|nr:NUDIX hydrolase [Dictyobacter alpinus]GCE24779.1 hypothetical protein KDA_02630 [Dictyobacter alpinus]
MTFSRLESIDVRHLTTNQPFCAGVILLQQGQLVVSLNADYLPSEGGNKTAAYRIRGVGGDQVPGETIWQCALREAKAKLQVELTLLPSPATYFHEIDTGEQYPVNCTDTIAPFLLERQSNLYPYTPMHPGLPAGPYTYFSLFLAQTVHPLTQPGTVAGLLFIQPHLWPILQQQPTLETLLQHGATIMENTRLVREHRIWVHPWESFTLAATLLQRHPELL